MKMVFGYTDANGNEHSGTVNINSPQDMANARALIEDIAGNNPTISVEGDGFSGIVGQTPDEQTQQTPEQALQTALGIIAQETEYNVVVEETDMDTMLNNLRDIVEEETLAREQAAQHEEMAQHLHGNENEEIDLPENLAGDIYRAVNQP